MKYVASSANLSGQSLERMSGALAVLANRGLKGEMAGASMAMALSQLSGKDVQQELAGMGVAVTDAEGTTIGLAWRINDPHPLIDEFIGVVRGRTVNSSRTQQDRTRSTDESRPTRTRPAGQGRKSQKVSSARRRRG